MRWLLALILLLLPSLASAQDKGFVASTLEQSLSGPGRTVTITGFTGALSSQAKLAELTVADARGVWLTLKGVTLDWSRAALLSGRVEVNELSAETIQIARLPQSPPTQAPAAAAPGFSLPELPVSIQIGKIAAQRVELGAPVLGQAAVLTVAGKLSLAGGQGAADLEIRRIDGPQGSFTLAAGYDNESRVLSLKLAAQEAAGGLIAGLIGLPGAPALALSAAGTGPIDSYKAQIGLATDGQPRLTGTVALSTLSQPNAPATRTFTADLAGDIAPLFAPEYRSFFGPHVQLALAGSQAPDGTLTLSALKLAARAITLGGRLTIGPDGLPRLIDLSGRIASRDGRPVLLPLAGPRTEIAGADLALAFDAARGSGWSGRIALRGLNRAGFAASDLTLAGDGSIDIAQTAVTGRLQIGAQGLAPADAALARAIGTGLDGQIHFAWRKGAPLELPQLALSGQGYGLTAQGTVDGLSAAFTVKGSAQAKIDDLARFSDLAGRPLTGRGSLDLTGTAALLAGSFDLDARLSGEGLGLGQPQLDALLRGASRVSLSAKRDAAGTTLRRLTVQAATLSAEASGTVAPDAADLSAKLDFTDLSALGRGYGGALAAQVGYKAAQGLGRLSLTGRANNLALGQPEADKLLRGTTTLSLDATRSDGRIRVDDLTLTNPQLSAKAQAKLEGASRTLMLTARLADLALLAPGFPGPLSLDGSVADQGQGYRIDLAAQGPAALNATVKGTLAADFASADLTASGGIEGGVVNGLIAPRSIRGPVRFDLRLNGPLRPAALAGTVALGPARLAAPAIGLAADPLTATARLGGGRAVLSAKATVGGGTVTLEGPVDLSAPYGANLAARLSDVLFKNPELFSTRVSGDLTLAGPLTGGARIAGLLRLGQTEIRVPSTGFGGSGAIPDGLRFSGETAAERATRARAGLVKTASQAQGGGRPFGLDLTIAAPNQVFIRGRGLDAELGGQVKLAGTTDNVIPSGGFQLLRGRLDILGKRFDLTQANLQLEGQFVPYVQIAAASTNNGITSTIAIEGQATDPKITFSSSPPLPQEEVLSQLLFGQGLSKISPFQAAQLASAVATLAGKGGEGIVGRLRSNFGLDNLDVQTTASGAAEVKAGKYISRRVYSEVSVGADGKSSVSLNFDLTKSVTVKGTAGSDGATGIGLYYQRDY